MALSQWWRDIKYDLRERRRQRSKKVPVENDYDVQAHYSALNQQTAEQQQHRAGIGQLLWNWVGAIAPPGPHRTWP